MNNVERLEWHIANLQESKEEINKEVAEIIDRYWLLWKIKNREIITRSKSGDSRLKVGKVAPSLRIYKEGICASYVRWRIYDDSYAQMNLRKKGQQHFADELGRDKTGITSLKKILKVARDWERQLIERTHAQLTPLIKELNAMNEAIKKLRVAIRAIEKIEAE